MERRIFDRASRLLDHDDTNVKVRDRSETSTQSIPKLTLFFFIFLHFQFFRWRKGNELHRQGGEKRKSFRKTFSSVLGRGIAVGTTWPGSSSVVLQGSGVTSRPPTVAPLRLCRKLRGCGLQETRQGLVVRGCTRLQLLANLHKITFSFFFLFF